MKNNHANKFAARHVFCLFAGLLLSFVASAQNRLTDLQTMTNDDGSLEIVFVFDDAITAPKIFATEVPPRIAVDLFDVENATGKRNINVASGSVKDVRLVSAGNRTRAVLDLTQNANFDTQVEGNRLKIKVEANDRSGSRQMMASHKQAEIQNIDFRRGKKGQGKVILKFSNPDVVVNTLETADGVILEIHNAQLPAELDRKLDVVDFATPVSYIDTHQKGDTVRVQVETSQANEHYAYQTGDQYVLEVAPVKKKAAKKSGLDAKKKYNGAKVSFNFQDIPVRSLLQMVADVSGFNVVVADSVQGNVTLRLKDVPWDQALDIILESKQLDKRQNGDVIWVAPAEEIAAREQQKLESQKEKEELEPVKTIFLQVNYAKAEELASLLQGGSTGEGDSGGGQSLLSERGSVAYDERTNTLLISDIPSRLKMVEELVKRLDRPVEQVQIESRIVIASDKFGEELGVRFGVTGAQEDSNGNILSMGGSLEGLDRLNNAALINRLSGSDGSGLPNFDPDYSDPGNHIQGAPLGERLNVNLPSSSNAAKWAWSILASDYLLDLELSALETEGKGEVISTPRVITTNQKEAVIQKGVEIPYEQATSSGATSVQFKKAVLELRVTPLITPDDRIDLTLKVSKDSVGQLVPTSRGGTVPSIDTRSIETRLLIENGQTVVLGGVYEHERRSDRSKVPFLGDLPAIGTLFRNKKISNDKAELLIFVTPTIIKQNF